MENRRPLGRQKLLGHFLGGMFKTLRVHPSNFEPPESSCDSKMSFYANVGIFTFELFRLGKTFVQHVSEQLATVGQTSSGKFWLWSDKPSLSHKNTTLWYFRTSW
jgi:hypothetical protein